MEEKNLYKELYKNLISFLEEQSRLYDTDYAYNHYQRVLDVAKQQKEELLHEKKEEPKKVNVDSGDYMSYEAYKQYLYTLPLSSQEYEQHIKSYCRKHRI